VLKALLFDVDGTLADTEREGHRLAYNEAFVAHGLDWQWSAEFYGQLLAVTGGKERLRHYLEQFQPGVAWDPATGGLIGAVYQTKTELYQRRLLAGEIPLRPGVARLLREARTAGLLLGVVTTTSPGNVTTLLEQTLGAEALDWFSVIAAGDIVPAKKPAPDIYLWALTQLQLPASACLAIEDSAVGLQAATGAGLATLITVNDYTRGEDFGGALAVLSDLGEPDAPYRRLDQCGSGVVDVAQLHAWLSQ